MQAVLKTAGLITVRERSGLIYSGMPAAKRRTFIAWRRQPQEPGDREAITRIAVPSPLRGRKRDARRMITGAWPETACQEALWRTNPVPGELGGAAFWVRCRAEAGRAEARGENQSQVPRIESGRMPGTPEPAGWVERPVTGFEARGSSQREEPCGPRDVITAVISNLAISSAPW